LTLATRKHARLEDPGAELLDRVSLHWNRYGKIVLGVVIGLLVVGGGVFFAMRSRAATESQAAGRLAEANIMFWSGYYQQSLDRAKQVAQQYPNAPSGLEAHRLAGDNSYWLGDFKNAAAEYRRYLDKAKPGLLADAARRSLAYSLESSGQYKEAADTYESLVGKFERESSAEMLYAAARCYRLLNQPAEAIKRLKRLTEEFGETQMSNRARIAQAELGAQSTTR
jgi:tetratricopeptide (TPR) repeat protein